MFKESEDNFTNRKSGLIKTEALRQNDSLLHEEATQPSQAVHVESTELLTLFSHWPTSYPWTQSPWRL
jgi:hypothetical protein